MSEGGQDLEDAELLRRWSAGDQAAGGVLFERHFNAVYRFFRTKTGDAVDDLVQQTFLGCTEACHRFRGQASFRTFLFQIARYQLYAHYRRRNRVEGTDIGLSSVQDLSPSASAVLVKREQEALLLEALQRLPLDMQIALELHYFEGLNRTQIAEVLEVPGSTVAGRLRRGREQLAEELELGCPAHGRETALELDRWAERLRKRLFEAEVDSSEGD